MSPRAVCFRCPLTNDASAGYKVPGRCLRLLLRYFPASLHLGEEPAVRSSVVALSVPGFCVILWCVGGGVGGAGRRYALCLKFGLCFISEARGGGERVPGDHREAGPEPERAPQRAPPTVLPSPRGARPAPVSAAIVGERRARPPRSALPRRGPPVMLTAHGRRSGMLTGERAGLGAGGPGLESRCPRLPCARGQTAIASEAYSCPL